jgi:hypothetical protein
VVLRVINRFLYLCGASKALDTHSERRVSMKLKSYAKTIFVVAATWAASGTANAGQHTLSCSGNSEQLYVSIDGTWPTTDGRLPTEAASVGEVWVSRIDEQTGDNVVVEHVTNAQVRKLDFASAGTPEQSVQTLNLDLGRSGNVSVSLLDPKTGNSILKSTLMTLNHPSGTEVTCGYFFVTGPKPALSGGN